MDSFIPCSIRTLPDQLQQDAADTAVQMNCNNAPPVAALAAIDVILSPDHLALLTARYWGVGGVKLTVGFMEPVAADLKSRILSHMNAWGQFCNVTFVLSQTDPQVRITLQGDGYWSYLGPDILHIPKNQPTMSLQRFTMATPEGEYRRVVRHETGHTLGFPHEQQLPEIVADLDPAKTIAWGKSALGWSDSMIRSQILTPLDVNTLRMTSHADRNGIMCYALPASITKSGQAIPGGLDIDDIDAAFAASLYPLVINPPPPPPPPPPPMGTRTIVITGGSITVDGKPI